MLRPIVTAGWPEEAFIGDILACTLEGRNLDTVTEIKVAPAAKGVTAHFGDPHGKLDIEPQRTATALTVTFEIDYNTYPGEKSIELISPAGPSNALPFLIMM
ncbi:MAG: hypothetical protein AAF704_01995 [Cyanobacteria bacterium P01_D01_bin.123]